MASPTDASSDVSRAREVAIDEVRSELRREPDQRATRHKCEVVGPHV
jgi:hypothetical protein